MDEFARIATYFAPLAGPEGLGLTDDAAIWPVEAGQHIILSKDMVVEGVHVPRGALARVFAQRAMRTNLSDLAAMGASPRGYLLGLGLPAHVHDAWVSDFADALRQDQEAFGLTLWGGDSVRTGQDITVSMTMIGAVAAGAGPLKRSGAKLGDDLYVSGTIGRAGAGLAMALSEMTGGQKEWLEAYEAPQPRLALGAALRGIASACADVSDGLLADAGHIGRASDLTAAINLADVPIDDDLPLSLVDAVSAGDDYELVFTAAPDAAARVFTVSETLGLRLTCIGRMVDHPVQRADAFVAVYDATGQAIAVSKAGWQHTE